MPVTDDINDVPICDEIDKALATYDIERRNGKELWFGTVADMASLLKQSAALMRLHIPQSHKLRSLFSAREIEAREREEAEARLAANWCKAGPVADAATYEVPDDDDTFGQGEPAKIVYVGSITRESLADYVATYASRPDVVGPAFERAMAESSNL